MRIINKKMATSLLGGLLSIVPISKANTHKLAYGGAGDMHSNKAMIKVSKKLNGLPKDTYDASKKFVTSPSKSSNASKAEQKVANTSFNIEKFLIGSGSKLVANTNQSKIYEISSATALKLKFDVVEVLGDDVKKIEMAVPKINNVKITDCPIACTLKKEFEESAGGRTEKWSTLFSKVDGPPIIVELKQITISNGKSLTISYSTYLPNKGNTKGSHKVGFSETLITANNGDAKKIEYGFSNSNDGDAVISKADFEDGKTTFLTGFEELYERSSIKNKKNELQKSVKTNVANNAVKDRLREEIASKEKSIDFYKSLIKSQEEIRTAYWNMVMMETDYYMKQMYMTYVTTANSTIEGLNKLINDLNIEKAQLIKRLEAQ